MLSRLGGFFKVKGKIKPGQKPSGSSDVGPQTNVPPSIQPVPPSQDVELLLQTEHQQTTSSLPMAAAPPKQTIGALPEHDGSNSNAQTHECTATPPVSASTVSETDKSVTIVAQTVAPPSSSAQTADPPAQQLERETQNASPSLLSSASVIPIDLTSLWRDALNEYTKQTGTDLDAGPLTDRLNGCISVNDIMDILEEHTRAFAEFRKGGAKTQLLRALKPIATAVLALQPSETLGEGIAVVFQPAKAIVGAVIVLLKATKDVSSSYDSLVDLLNCISKFLDRLSIYAGKSLTILMQEILVKTLANVVSILALATREVNQGRLGKYVRTLLGDTHVEDALKQLTRLGSTETQMIGVESLRLTYSLSTTLNELMQGSKESTKEIQRALEALQLNMGQTLQELKYDSDVQKHRNWLTPPDPSINHNLALRSYSEGTSAWFIDGQVMGEWKTTSSLLWIHGKPGSGKTILCTAIIENIRRLCLIQEKSNLAYFYCNFQDAKKQNARGLLSHVLIHFSAASHACSQLLSGLWSSHSNGSHQPSEHDLRQCLKSVIALLADHSLYIVIDALDECPDSSIDSHSQRRDVLMLIREIVDWGFHNVHICVTSRPEQDIREAMEALSPRSISLHTESGQTDEISSYVHSVIESDRAFRRWKASDRELAIQRLGEKANGMFRWVFCQLEMLRGCHPATIRKVLDDLPKTLDETYRRVLQTLDTPGWEYTHRLFECLIVCARPLRVDELADVLAIDFDSGPIPQFVTDWRPSDPKSDILSFCSSMIVIDSETGTVQFAHFSVQEGQCQEVSHCGGTCTYHDGEGLSRYSLTA
ncbi:hypothetical protein CERSUDRAFT_126167 [Gelatoporia subvermispora B]|uniref:NACHT domain-containing protein n=1 Tax=Ceriporiopsis subvermispora (strain B) TaxID=914234 RepID=M2PCL7_CERS8|nr:hypothetical protein CERSUDRAFT_126167 [Gelatoporia subvermispora B]